MDEEQDTDNAFSEIEPSDQMQTDNNNEREYVHNREFERDAVAAAHMMWDDFGRRLELASNRQNTMIQSVGIILAFASILLTETISTMHQNAGNAYNVAALVAFFFCCTFGVLTVWEWRGWKLYTGLDSSEVTDAFNERGFIYLQRLLLKGVIWSHDLVRGNNFIIKNRITYMMAFLFAGMAFTVMDMVMT
jgi:hypothetical protein